MGRRVAEGRSVRVTVPQSTTLAQGGFALLSGFLGFSPTEVVTGVGVTKPAVLIIEPAEYETDQIDAGDAFALGTAVYWDEAEERFTETAAGNRFAGIVTSAKDVNDVIWLWFCPEQNASEAEVNEFTQAAAVDDVDEAVPAAVAAADATTPANVAYTQADQTALADLAIANKAAVNGLRLVVVDLKAQLNELLGALRDAGILAE